MDSGQSTRTAAPSERRELLAAPPRQPRLPFSSPRNATTSLRGRWGSAKQLSGRPAPACEPGLSATATRGRGHRSRGAPGGPRRSAGCGQLAPGAAGKDGAGRAEGKEPRPLARAAGGLLIPWSLLRFGGTDAPVGESCCRSPPGVRRASTSLPTAGGIRSSAGPCGAWIWPP